MENKSKPSIEDLVRRVGALEEALEQMFGAFREDLATLREDLKQLASTSSPPASPRKSSRPSSRPVPASNRASDRHGGTSIFEEPTRPGKKDPRSE